MKFTVTKPVEIDIKYVRIAVPIRYGDEDIPYPFPGRIGDMFDITVCIETGKIVAWLDCHPGGDIYMKVVDCGLYYLLDASFGIVASIENDYVPHGVVPGDYGDYIDLKIVDGVIVNWPKKIDVSAFFRGDE
jgi:hypothetical protein